MAQEPIVNTWPGTSTFAVGDTPFGYFDNDSQFKADIDKFAKWAAMRLGYPITDVELININFYAAYEEAIMYYGQLVNSSQAKDILLDLKGTPTIGLNLTGQYYTPSLKGVFKTARQYGIAGPSGGKQTWYSGSINVESGRQVYLLDDPTDTELEEGTPGVDNFTIKKIFHNRVPATRKAKGIGVALDTYDTYSDFGFNSFAGVEMMLMPLNHTLQLIQAIELQDDILKSSYTFKITGNRIQIFPIPTANGKLWFNYVLDDDLHEEFLDNSMLDSVISDISNIPFHNMVYSSLNMISRSWINKYALAICKEMLGLIRSKYSTLPIPDSEITLNGEALVDQARTEMESLTTELKELLEALGHTAQMERRTTEAESLQAQLAAVPMKFYVR